MNLDYTKEENCMSFINLYYGAKAPVVAGARQFNTVQEAMDAGWPALGATDGKNGTGSQITE